MIAHARTLLVLGAMLWVAPLGAEQSGSEVAWSDAPSGCPYARAQAEAAAAAQAASGEQAAVKADGPYFDVPDLLMP